MIENKLPFEKKQIARPNLNVAPQFNKQAKVENVIRKGVVLKNKVYTFSKRQVKKINKDNAIYYFSGATLFVIVIIFITPIIYNYLTRRDEPNIEIISGQRLSPTIIEPRTSTPLKQIELPTNSSNSTTNNITVANREEMIQIFQKKLNENQIESLGGYIENGTKIYFWNGSCCRDRDVGNDYIISVIRSLNTEGTTWNFDQGQPNIKRVQGIDNIFNDNYVALNNRNTFIGIKFAPNNKISEVNIVNNINVMFDSLIQYSESDLLNG